MVSWCSRLSHVSHTHGVLSSSLSETILFPLFLSSSLFSSTLARTFTHMHAHKNKTKKHNGVFLLIKIFFHPVSVSLWCVLVLSFRSRVRFVSLNFLGFWSWWSVRRWRLLFFKRAPIHPRCFPWCFGHCWFWWRCRN